MEGLGFVVEGGKEDGKTEQVFPELESISKVYPEWVILDGKNYYRHIMCKFEMYVR